MSSNLSVLIGLALGTLVSEDLSSIGAGLLARDGQIAIVPAIAACVVGVYAGDLALWLAGRVFGRRVLRLPWLAKRLNASAMEKLSARIDARLFLAVIGSRFLPGSRLPMYVAAGIWGQRPVAFAAWSLGAVLVWTPLLVLLTELFGSAVTASLVGELGVVLQSVVTAAVVFAGLRLAARVLT